MRGTPEGVFRHPTSRLACEAINCSDETVAPIADPGPRHKKLRTVAYLRGTEISNPSPSSGESVSALHLTAIGEEAGASAAPVGCLGAVRRDRSGWRPPFFVFYLCAPLMQSHPRITRRSAGVVRNGY